MITAILLPWTKSDKPFVIEFDATLEGFRDYLNCNEDVKEKRVLGSRSAETTYICVSSKEEYIHLNIRASMLTIDQIFGDAIIVKEDNKKLDYTTMSEYDIDYIEGLLVEDIER